VKLLLDENLSPRLVEFLSDVYPGLQHVEDVGLGGGLTRGIAFVWAKDSCRLLIENGLLE
jgi:hypothetical protein